MTTSTTPDPFEREAYIALADEVDPMGALPGAPEPVLADFDETFVTAARAFADRNGLPFPVRSLDEALRMIEETER